MKKRRTFNNSFKQKAIRMVVEEGRPAAEVARELGINPNLLYNWKSKYITDNQDYNPKRVGNEDTAQYIKKLERENKKLKEEKAILKKAAIFFAADP